MAVRIQGKYQGDLRVELLHEQSNSIIETDAPLDNNGKGERFSPTDLVVSALGACMLTIMGIIAKRDGIDLSDLSFSAEKHMSTDAPRRIARIVIELKLPKNLTNEQKNKLENAAKACPVYHSLDPQIEKIISFV